MQNRRIGPIEAFFLLVVATAVAVSIFAVFTNAAHGQEPDLRTVDIVLPSTETGISGGIFTVDVTEGIEGDPFDINCDGTANFLDVIAVFDHVIGRPVPAVFCIFPGDPVHLTAININPDLTPNTVTDLNNLHARFGLTDTGRIVEPGATNVLIATVEYEMVSPGSAKLVISSEQLDDDTGAPHPPFSVGVVVP